MCANATHGVFFTLTQEFAPPVSLPRYPEVEKNFRMDFSTIMAIFEHINPEFVEPLEAMEECFKSEFNYSLEAANLRRMCAEVKPHFTR